MAQRLETLLVTLDFSVIGTGSFTPFPDSTFPVFQIQITNTTDQPIFISTDGINNGLIIPSVASGGGPFFSIPFFRNIGWPMPLFVKSAGMAPSSGTVYMQYLGCSEAAWEGQ